MDIMLNQHEETLEELKLRIKDIQDEDKIKLKNNFYLYQWLKAGNFNVDKAETLIRNSFKWRRENEICTTTDDFPHSIAQQFPIYTNSISKLGQPVGTLNGGRWDLKQFLKEEKESQNLFVRYCALLTLQTENIWLQNNSSINISDPPQNIIFLINSLGYSVKQISPATTACAAQILQNIRHHFPPMVERVIFINVGKVFSLALKIIKPFISFLSLEIFGGEREKWKSFLTEIIPSDQLGPEFGGTKENVDQIWNYETKDSFKIITRNQG